MAAALPMTEIWLIASVRQAVCSEMAGVPSSVFTFFPVAKVRQISAVVSRSRMFPEVYSSCSTKRTVLPTTCKFGAQAGRFRVALNMLVQVCHSGSVINAPLPTT
jgi:hypothetical protein